MADLPPPPPVDLGHPFTRRAGLHAGLTDAQLQGERFRRLFQGVYVPAHVPMTPARWVESCRLDLARSLLETTDLTVAQVASAVGTGDASTLHRLFDRHLATTPAAYRTHHSNRPRNPR